jgi:hypothetical protein
MTRLLHRAALILLLSASPTLQAQFVDPFDAAEIEGWFTQVGDGTPRIEFLPRQGHARMQIDATPDRYNVWWTIIKRDIASHLDLTRLQDPAYELRVEARVRSSHGPRRVNFMLNTQRTTDFHEHLREYDLERAGEWYVISLTTNGFDARPGDSIFVQLGVTDWGPDRYHLDIDYYRADVVRRDQVGPDLGEPLVYHPAVPDVTTFAHRLSVAHDAVIVSDFPDVNFNDWHVPGPRGPERVLTVSATHSVVLRWDFGAYAGQKADGAGLLELTTHSQPMGGRYIDHYGEDLGIEFGKVRVFEIIGGDSDWDQESVTYRTLLRGQAADHVFNGQMVIDLDLAAQPGAPTYFTLPRPVMQRLLDGRTKGLLLRPLGALVPTVYASEDPHGRGPQLYFTTQRDAAE